MNPYLFIIAASSVIILSFLFNIVAKKNKYSKCINAHFIGCNYPANAMEA